MPNFVGRGSPEQSTQSLLDIPHEVDSREGGRKLQHRVIRARYCPGRRGHDGRGLPGGGDGK